ncbi:MAG: hypothetical protein K0S41_3801 [Anaerocolumna sp.]|jgi:predicted glycogen debranching enzyme|nr:hypothetical protein [Anaerocolumna sp.]
MTKYTLGRNEFRTFEDGMEKEWLLTNGIGGFANQTIIGANSRIFSGYLIASMHPPVDRMLIFAKTHEAVKVGEKEYDFAAQSYIGTKREGQHYLNRFELDVLPTFIYEVDGFQMRKTIALEYGKNTAVVCYKLKAGSKDTTIAITPCFNFRPFGDVTERNQLEFKQTLVEQTIGGHLLLKPDRYSDMTVDFYASKGEFYDRSLKPTSMATPNYMIEENEVYPMDNRNGFLGVDNHATPYDILVHLKPYEETIMFLSCSVHMDKDNIDILNQTVKDGFMVANEYKERMNELMERIPYKNSLAKKLAWAADAFIVNRESTGLKTILAGYPWFADWGRDTMIALQGLTLSTRRFDDARDILESFSRYVKNGMIPNVFPGNAKEEPQYNTIDASLWYFYSVYKYLNYTGEPTDYEFIRVKIYPCLKEIINAYKNGTLYGIKMDEDGLIQGGSDLDQLTWMDVKVGNWVVTPRHGKAVEINALWYNALMVMGFLADKFGEDKEEYVMLSEQIKESFVNKFWNEKLGYLYDVISYETNDDVTNSIDVTDNINNGEEIHTGSNSRKEVFDSKIRPNQIYAVSLPFTMLDREKEKRIVQVVREHLYTPYGLRSLSYEDKDYKPQYIGKLILRDGAYHMGTTWGYLLGAFITAFCKVGEYSKEVVMEAKEMCEYMEDHMNDGCLNGIAEIFDGDFACTSRGCYTQAWSVGEVLRAYTEDVLEHM